MTDELRYPIGQFEHREEVTEEHLELWLAQIEALPRELLEAVRGLSDEQFDTRYRPGGWTVRQVVHHLCDSHLNSYLRFKWALTEDEPTIKTYDEVRAAELADYRVVPVETSLGFLELLHRKWVMLLRALTPDQWSRCFVHPDLGRLDLATTAGLYAWHGRHHLAHITTTIEREGW